MKTSKRFLMRDGMHSSNASVRMHFSLARTRFYSGVVLCLVALFSQIVVPIAHRYFLDVEEMAEKTMAAAAHPCRAGNSFDAIRGGRRGDPSSRSSHNAESCAICHVLLHASSFVGVPPQGLAAAFIVVNRLDRDRASFDLVRFIPAEYNPRAPPSR